MPSYTLSSWYAFLKLALSQLIGQQGFGLTIGSDIYLLLDSYARRNYYLASASDGLTRSNITYVSGQFTSLNITNPTDIIRGVLGVQAVSKKPPSHLVKGKPSLLIEDNILRTSEVV